MTLNSALLWVSQNVGWAIGLSIVLMIFMWNFIWKLSRWMQAVDDTVIDVQALKRNVAILTERMATLTERMAALTERVDALTKRVDALTESVATLAEGLGVLKGRMDEFSGDGPNSMVARTARQVVSILKEQGMVRENSPLSLSDKGEDIARRIDADTIAQYYIDSVEENTQGMDAYEVQEFCFEFAYGLKQDLREKHAEDYARVSSVAYDTGQIIESILHRVVGITLRDKILQKKGLAT